MEVCVDNILSVRNALNAGADRVELCSSLTEGGLTPTVGFHRTARKIGSKRLTKPLLVFPIIRPRGGDFHFSEDEVEIMIGDIRSLSPADGFVIGCLTPDGEVDVEACKRLIDVAKVENGPEIPITFHRAFDMVKDVEGTAKTLQNMGISRVLTSGTYINAYKGRFVIRDLQISHPKLIFMAGGGINENNLKEILETTGIKEFHASARETIPSKMRYRNERCSMGSGSTEFSLMVSSEEKIKNLIELYKSSV